MNKARRDELLQQMHETELGGVKIYETALKNVLNADLKKEWTKYLDQTRQHVEVVKGLMGELGVKANPDSPGRKVVRHIGESLVAAMTMAKAGAPPAAAEIVACECVVLAETKDHANWELLNKYAEEAPKDERAALDKAIEAVEDEEDEHVYHSKGWCRELAIAALGMEAVLPPPEEQKDVKTAIGAARAKSARAELL